MKRHTVVHLLLLVLFNRITATDLRAQEQAPPKLGLEAAIEKALNNYPALRAAAAQAAAAGAGVDLARTSYLPRLDLLWQENLATRNNVFGLLLPQSTIPSISGPVLSSPSYTGTWGSAGGMLLSWEPFDFGLRKAGIGLARSLKERADAGASLSRLEVAASAADAFLILLTCRQRVRAAQANIDRIQAFAVSVRALVESQLRPGVDASRADAELAAARTQLILAQQDEEMARTNLSEALGIAGTGVEIEPGPCLQPPPNTQPPAFKLELHPLALFQASAVASEHMRLRALERSYVPRISYQFALFGRGSGALLDGRFDASRGLWPDTGNWATGITVTFPVFDIFALRARRRAQAGSEAAEQARQEQVIQNLRSQEKRAEVLVDAAKRIAGNMPAQLNAARETLTGAQARYEAGLATVVEVADAQRLVAQAEAEDAIARVNVWRALLAMARSGGDLQPFLQQVRMAGGRQGPESRRSSSDLSDGEWHVAH